jgi:hypothetical protein
MLRGRTKVKWTGWLDIDEARERNGRLSRFGLYQIRAVSSSGEPIAIHRLKGIDPEGILYVGRSGFRARSPNRTLANRIGEFMKQHHSGGITYGKAASRLRNEPRFVGHRLQVRALFLSDSVIAREETRVLEAYFNRHAEWPPCNSNAGSRKT